MLNNLLPQRIDNTYRGHKLALWILALVAAMKIVQGLMVMFNGAFVIRTADGVPLDTYTPAAAQTVLSLWALSGLERVILSLLCVLVLVRYRRAVPFMFALLAFDYLARQLTLHFIPLVRTEASPGTLINLVLFSLMIVGLALSLWDRDNRNVHE